MLAVEAAVMAMIVLGLFRLRTVLGLTPLYIVLGGLQYLEATLSLRVEVLPSIWIYPASTVMFTPPPVRCALPTAKIRNSPSCSTSPPQAKRARRGSRRTNLRTPVTR